MEAAQTVPVLILGDAPNLNSGLARIARDLAGLLHRYSLQLGIEVSQAGLRYDGSPWPWRVYPVSDEENWGFYNIGRIWEWASAERPGILFTIWDPARCYGTSEVKLGGCERWGYFAVDSSNARQRIGGPALTALSRYKRVLGYGEWGAKVLARSLEVAAVEYLPHGLHLGDSGWRPIGEKSEQPLLGAVATNQPRKDWGLFFQTAALLKEHFEDLQLWIHTDEPVTGAWSIPQLALDFGFDFHTNVLLTSDLDDVSLNALYSRCWVTLGIGAGEGFGYPLIESMASGTPVIHGNFGGGTQWVPRQWLVEPYAWRLEGPYALQRPVFRAEDWAFAVARVLSALKEDATLGAWAKGRVSNLGWDQLEGRWLSWFQSGLRAFREQLKVGQETEERIQQAEDREPEEEVAE